MNFEDFAEEGPAHRPQKEPTFKHQTPVYVPLTEINLKEELAKQYAEAKAHQAWALENTELLAPRDISDAIKTTNGIIQHIIKMQEALHNIENMKFYEEAVITAVKVLPDESKHLFFEVLKASLPKE